jgi:hypothetical protein
MGRDHGNRLGGMSALPVSRRSSEAASQVTIHFLERHTPSRRHYSPMTPWPASTRPRSACPAISTISLATPAAAHKDLVDDVCAKKAVAEHTAHELGLAVPLGAG